MIVILFALVFTIPAHSAIKKLAQTGLQFLKVDVSARSAAMGGASTIASNNASAMFSNPAGLALMSLDFDVFAGRTQWIADISYNAVGVAKSLGNWGNVGINTIFAEYGDIIGTRVAATEQGFEETGMLDVGAYAIGVTYAKSLTNKFSVGGQIKYTYQHLSQNILTEGGEAHENKVSGFAYDFGTIFYPGFKSFRIGMSIRNFSPQFKYEEYAFELPLNFTISAAMDVLDLISDEHKNSLIFAVDAIHPRDYTERIHLGGEFWLMDMFAFRSGYKFNYDEEGLCAGLGFKYTISGVHVNFDYSYSEFGVFGGVNRFSIGFSF